MWYNQKLNDFRTLLDFNHKYLGKDFKNNYKWICWYVKQKEKQNINNLSNVWKWRLLWFIEDAIDIHKRVYRL